MLLRNYTHSLTLKSRRQRVDVNLTNARPDCTWSGFGKPELTVGLDRIDEVTWPYGENVVLEKRNTRPMGPYKYSLSTLIPAYVHVTFATHT